MKEYSFYSSIELAQDDDFLRWVKYPGKDLALDKFWSDWLAEHPEKRGDVEEARAYILTVASEGEFADTQRKKDQTWERLAKSMSESEAATARPSMLPRFYKIAASLLLLGVVLGTAQWLFKRQQGTTDHASISGSVVKEINNSTMPKTIVLADGSSIVLHPNSSLEFPKSFKEEYREVVLNGQAFFEISRNPKKPFFVYAGNLVTKVLGTSFLIRAVDGEENVLVQVKTGKVSVATQNQVNEEDKKNPQMDGVILNPNQQAVYTRSDSRLVKLLVEDPSLIVPSMREHFEFADVPLREVFSILEKAYGVDIIYEDELIGGCLVNISLDDMPLYDKMRVICKVVDAKYEILDTHIVVSGKGCKD